MTLSERYDPCLELSDYQLSAINDGYCYECPCGELLNSISAAVYCRKCRKYSASPGRFVIDIRTNEVVFGSLPSKEEAKHAEGIAELAKAISLNKFNPPPISDES